MNTVTFNHAEAGEVRAHIMSDGNAYCGGWVASTVEAAYKLFCEHWDDDYQEGHYTDAATQTGMYDEIYYD